MPSAAVKGLLKPGASFTTGSVTTISSGCAPDVVTAITCVEPWNFPETVTTPFSASASAQAESFHSETRRNGVARQEEVNFRPDGSVEGKVIPVVADAATAATARGTVDNLTAYLRLERQLAAKGTCALMVPVFDGRSRYDLVFSDIGKQVLSPEGGQHLEGNAIACRMTRHIRSAPEGEQGEGAHQGKFWYAPLLPGDVVVPVRMQLETQIGTVDAYLAELHGRGVDLQLMK